MSRIKRWWQTVKLWWARRGHTLVVADAHTRIFRPNAKPRPARPGTTTLVTSRLLAARDKLEKGVDESVDIWWDRREQENVVLEQVTLATAEARASLAAPAGDGEEAN